MTAAAAVAVCGSVLLACSGNCVGPSDVGAGCFAGASPVTCNAVRISITADGAYSFTANGELFVGSANGGRIVYTLPLGTNDVGGTTSASTLTIDFSSVTSTTNAIVKRGSISSASGPGATITPCSVTYTIPGNGTKPQSFLARFTLSTATESC